MEGAYTARAQRPAIGPAVREIFDAAIMPFRFLPRRIPERRHDVDERPGRAAPELGAPDLGPSLAGRSRVLTLHEPGGSDRDAAARCADLSRANRVQPRCEIS